MKISVNAVRDFNKRYHCGSDPAPEGVDKLVERIGAQLAAVEEVDRIGDKYTGAVIVKVVNCRKHENSDHLNICTIDDGSITPGVKRDENGHIQVVCGAPNVREGLTVVWLPPGATVPSSFGKEPFVLSVREIRGEISNGMLASPKELALGDSHDGILEIEEDIKPGTSFAEHYRLTDDVVIDMENKMFTHRPDLFGMLGIAREIAGIQGQKYTSPEWYQSDVVIDTPEEPSLHVKVRNEINELVPRFTVVPMAGVTVKPSPVWLQVELSRLGVRPINNIVDFTNFFMLETGQPLHAYDYDKVVAQDTDGDNKPDHATIVVRQPHDGEKLTLLNGKTIEPRPESILIASATKAIGLGGVMGGGDTEVDENTTNIILECATFDMYSIRRTSMAHGIFSDAVTRFNKGQSPLQNMAVLAKIVSDIERLADGKVAGPVIDDNHIVADVRECNALHPPVNVTTQFIHERLGIDLTAEQITTLLTNVEFTVTSDDSSNEGLLTVTAPFWRTDIEIPEDIVEEVGRLYGFDKLPMTLPKRDVMPAIRNTAFAQQARHRDVLSRSGANEVLAYSFVPGALLDKAGQDIAVAFKLSNALSPDLQYYRLSLMPSLLDKVHANIKAGYDEFALFELGRAHSTANMGEDGLPVVSDRLALVFAADAKKAASSYAGAAFYQARKYLDTVIAGSAADLSLVPLHDVSLDGQVLLEQMAAPFDPERSAAVSNGQDIIGIVGEYKLSVQKALKLPKFSAGFEVLTAAFGDGVASSYQTLPRFPRVTQDICLKVPVDVSYQTLHEFASNKLKASQPEYTLTELSALDIYQRAEDTDHKQITFRYSIASYERTLTDAEVAKQLNALAEAASETYGAERV